MNNIPQLSFKDFKFRYLRDYNGGVSICYEGCEIGTIVISGFYPWLIGIVVAGFTYLLSFLVDCIYVSAILSLFRWVKAIMLTCIGIFLVKLSFYVIYRIHYAKKRLNK